MGEGSVQKASRGRGQVKKGGALPAWSLVDLYASPDDKRIPSDLRSAGKLAESFRRKYVGKIAKTS